MQQSSTINAIVWFLVGLYILAAAVLIAGGLYMFVTGLLGPRT